MLITGHLFKTMTFEYNGLVWFQTIGLKETAVSDQSRFQANGGAVYNTPGTKGAEKWSPMGEGLRGPFSML